MSDPHFGCVKNISGKAVANRQNRVDTLLKRKKVWGKFDQKIIFLNDRNILFLIL
jgi:hypothetical protein